MPAFDAWDVVKVPFPYTDRPVRQRRPALVVSAAGLQQQHGLLWVLMITSAENRGWPGDVPIADLTGAGLPAPSVIRTAKIATIEAKDAERIGSLEPGARQAVRQLLLAGLASATN
ncbi:type II toxin-antitoxin system PemK/MazF family toxin [Magnetospirillum sp. UT-4]|uniref:type II toxin-antitoxin system PemK/MazF family toxin n=1 Tax=Magnetospirillum sp. UT-4 TaxID=2681467 RepID=UPI0013851973|nr:type II toxin-antitoxin system PemK/MazF family toxin [Magnetospirillum sp. UT-4]CAA7613944.1 PemK-like protein [Magnetospirillum sp. UT-4]